MNTFGWDTIFVATAAAANRSWVASQKQFAPQGLPFTGRIESTSLNGIFDPWQITSGGAGKLIHLNVPIRSGTVTVGNTAAVDLSGIIVTVEVPLDLLPAENGGGNLELRFAFQSTTVPAQDIKIIAVQDPERRLNFEQLAMFPPAMGACILANPKLMNFVFARLNPVAPGVPSWLAPTGSAFTYWETSGTPPVGYLGVLGVTDGRNITGMQRQLDSQIMAADGDAFFAISGAMFLRHVVQPMLPAVFGQGTTAASFTFKPDDSGAGSITNTGNIGLPPVRPAAITYHPKMTGVTVTLNTDQVQLGCSGNCDMHMGISLTFTGTYTNALIFDNSTRKLAFVLKRSSFTHDTHIPVYDYFIPGILGIGDAILAIVVPLVGNSIGNGMASNMGLLTLASQPPATVQWAGLENFSVSAVTLNNGLALAGSVS